MVRYDLYGLKATANIVPVANVSFSKTEVGGLDSDGNEIDACSRLPVQGEFRTWF